MFYVNFVWEILYRHLWAFSECKMQRKSDHDACRDSCNDDPKCLRMRHAYGSDMQANICNAICMLSFTQRCNDVFLTTSRLSNAGADSACWMYLLLDL